MVIWDVTPCSDVIRHQSCGDHAASISKVISTWRWSTDYLDWYFYWSWWRV